MLIAPHMLMIGASGRKVGKTTLACALLQRFRARGPLVGVKVTTCDEGDPDSPGEAPFLLTEETGSQQGKDTDRLRSAGAARVLWLRVWREQLQAGAQALMHRLGDAPAVCESNALRLAIAPGVFLMASGPSALKPSAARVRPWVDRLVPSVDGRPRFDANELIWDAFGWSMPVEATAIIMAGGQSRRMGQDKSLLPLAGQPLIARVADQLRGLCAEILISANDPAKYAFLKLPVIADRQPGQGALMGIASALAASSHDRNLVVACDIPHVDRALAREMLVRARSAEVVIPQVGPSYHEPLFAVYDRGLAGDMFALLAAGQRRIVAIFERARVDRLVLAPDEHIPNLNTPEEYRRHIEGGE